MRPGRFALVIALSTGVAIAAPLSGAMPAKRPPTTDIRVIALAAPASVRLGSRVTVGFSVRNAGAVAARTVALVVAVPSGATVEAMSSTSGTCTTRSCVLGTVKPKVARQIQVTIKPPATGGWPVTARVSSKTKDSRPANNTAVVRAKVVGDDTVKGLGSRSFRANAPPALVEVDAISGPRGEDPSGTFYTRYPVGAWIQSGVELRGNVVCMTVTGNRATVGGVVQQSSDSRYPAGTGVLLVFRDNGSPGAGRDTQLSFFGSDVNPRACPVPSEGEYPEPLLSDGDFTVHDEQP